MNSKRSRYIFLAALFAIALAFQTTIWFRVFTSFMTPGPEPDFGLVKLWAVILVLRVVTPLVSLTFGFYVASVRIWDRRAWLLLAVLVSFSILSNGSNSPDDVMQWNTPVEHLALVYHSIGLLSWPFWFIVFAIYFPERAGFDIRHPSLKWAILIPSLLACSWSIAMRVIRNEGGSLYETLLPLGKITEIVTDFTFWISIAVFLAILLVKAYLAKDPDSKRRLRVLFFGLGISLVPLFLLEAITKYVLQTRDVYLPGWLFIPVLSLFALFPVTLAYVTVVERALDVGVIVRQSLQYALARRGLVVLQSSVSLIVILLVAVFSGGMRFGERLLITALGVGAVLVIGLGARRTAAWIDRRFFREAYKSEQILTRLADSVASIFELETLLKTVTERISEALHISEVVVFLRSRITYDPAFAVGYPQPPPTSFDSESRLVEQLHNRGRALPVYFNDPRSWLTQIDTAESTALHDLGTELLLPIARGEELLGFLSLGNKRSEAPYSTNDIQLLQSVASQTALAIENSQLTATIASETAQREVMQRELQIAREVQQRLFPQTNPCIPNVDYFGMCRPANEVGGDYYDFIELPQKTLGIAIGDVSGKGIPASLLMASLQASLRGQTISGETSICRLMSNINGLIHATSPASKYATFFYGHYDAASNCLTYVNAGHNPPLLLRRTNDGKGDSELLHLDAGGPPVGLLPVSEYEEAKVDLRENDLLVLFTDGISEAMNSADEEWGEERLITAIQSLDGHPPEAMASQLLQAADKFTDGAPQHDDMTLVVFRFGPQANLTPQLT